MSLLPLSAEVVRLRRVAKACQAGELSRLEYRESRREVIRKFTAGNNSLNEDTVPRFDLEATLRRGFEAPAMDTGGKPNRLVWMCVLVALVAGFVIPSWAFGLL